MYGFGSKKALIEDFASKTLAEYSVVVINGYLQTINLKQVCFPLKILHSTEACSYILLVVKSKGSIIDKGMY